MSQAAAFISVDGLSDWQKHSLPVLYRIDFWDAGIVWYQASFFVKNKKIKKSVDSNIMPWYIYMRRSERATEKNTEKPDKHKVAKEEHWQINSNATLKIRKRQKTLKSYSEMNETKQ